MSDQKVPKQRAYRVVRTGGFWRYACQVKRFGIWWTFDNTDNEDTAKKYCERHAQPVVWEGMLP